MPPPRCFTHYWSNSTWQAYRATAKEGELMDHTASNMFLERGVQAGDFIYVVTVLRGALRLLAAVGAEYVLDPIHDLIPVCPNCHAVMHMRREEPYTVEDVSEMMRGSTYTAVLRSQSQ